MLLRPSSFCPKFILNFFLMAPQKKLYTKAGHIYPGGVSHLYRFPSALPSGGPEDCTGQTIIIFCIISARLLNSHKNSYGMRAFFPRTPPSIPSHPNFPIQHFPIFHTTLFHSPRAATNGKIIKIYDCNNLAFARNLFFMRKCN